MRAAWIAGIGASLLGSSAFGSFVAYNDFIGNYSSNGNVTQHGMASGGPLALKDVTTGLNVPAQMTVAYLSTTAGGTGPGAEFAAGTDADALFGGKVTNTGTVIWYGTAGNWNVDLTFTGLDPAQKYTFAGTLDRGNSSYANLRWTAISIADVDASTYAASASAHKVDDTKVSIDSYNTLNGYVAKWIDVQPGADGDFTVRYTWASLAEMPAGTNPGTFLGYGYGPSGIMLQEQAVPEPAAMGLLALGGLLGLRRRR